MALVNSLRRVLLQSRQLSKISFARLGSSVRLDPPAQKDELEFRQRLKDLPDVDRFGSFSDRPAVVPDTSAHEPDIEAELDSHVPLGVRGRPHDRPWYVRKMKNLLAEGRPKEAADVLYTEMLVRDRVKPTRYIYNSVMFIHRDHGEAKEARKLFYMMKSYGCTPSRLTHGLLFEACGKADDLQLGSEIATQFYLSLPQADLPHSTYSAALTGFSKTKNLPMTMRALDDMLLNGRYRPSQYDLRSVLEACRSDRAGGAGLALQMWRRFRQIGRFAFNDSHYTLLLQCLLGCGFGDVSRAAQSITSEDFDYKALMGGEGAPPGPEAPNTEAAAALDLPARSGFDDALILSSPVNLLSAKQAPPHRESLLRLLEESKPAPHRHLSLIGGLEGLAKTMAEDGVKMNKFHASVLYRKIPAGHPEIDQALRLIVDGIGDVDTVLVNSFVSSRALSADEVVSEVERKNMRPDLVTYGIMSRHANTIPRIRDFFDKLAAAGVDANDVMCLNIFLAAGLDFNAKSYLLHLMVKHDISASAKLIETIEHNVHSVRRHVIERELEQKSPSFTLPFFLFCTQYTQWLKKIAVLPSDVHRLEDKT